MLILWRRHNPTKCEFTSRRERKCFCPIWTSGTLPSGERVYKSLKLRNWTLAEKLIDKWQLDGVQPKQSRITIEQWRTAFLQDDNARNLAKETIRKHRWVFQQLESFCQEKGILHVSELDLTLLSEFRATWKVAPRTAGKELEILRGFFKFAVARKWISENPATGLKAPRVKSNPTLPFSDEEMTRILVAATNPKTRAFIQTMRYSGLRISDAATLETTSLHGNHLRLYMAKTGQPVQVLLPDFVVAALRAVKNSSPRYFFCTGASQRTSAAALWRERLAKVFEAAKITDGHPHRFRDTFAVSLLQAGVSLESVSTLLGHQNLKVTQQSYSPWVKSRQDALDIEVSKALPK